MRTVRVEPVVVDIQLEDLRRSERTMTVVRWVAVPFSTLQVLVYQDRPYPSGMKALALALVGLLAAGAVALWMAHKRARTASSARNIALAGLALDLLVASGFVAVYTFDHTSALWAVLFILPLEGAIRFQLRGAVIAWIVVTILYTIRELWGSGHYGYQFQWNSISFRMGIGLLIALVAGLMARDLVRERRRLARAVEELRRVDGMRAALVSTLAHDVRSPLTAIRGNLELLLARGDQIPADKAAELMGAADRQARRIEQLATGLLDLARLEQGHLALDLQPTDLREAVTQALAYVGSTPVDVRIPEGIVVPLDPPRFEQIVVNLVTNAQKHGDPPIAVEAQPQNGRVVIEFVDQGRGVSVEQLDNLFQPFATQTAGSTGLGLSIVRAMVQAHGGEVGYERNEPRGARFKVILPTGPAGPA